MIDNRLGGILLLTRSLGDFDLVQKGLIAEPFISYHLIINEGLLILASDGLWDVWDPSIKENSE